MVLPTSLWSSSRPATMCSVMTNPMATVMEDASCGLALVTVHAAQPIERRHLVALGQRGIVEYRVDEVVHGSVEGHDGLADVDQLAGALADDVHAQHLAGVAMEYELEAA